MVIWSRTQSPAVFSPNLRAYPSGLEVWTFQSCVLARIEPFQGGDFFFRFYLYISRTDKLMRCPFKPFLWHQPRTGLMGCAGVGRRGEGPSCLGQARHCPAVWGLQGAEPREDPNAPVVWHAPQVVLQAEGGAGDTCRAGRADPQGCAPGGPLQLLSFIAPIPHSRHTRASSTTGMTAQLEPPRACSSEGGRAASSPAAM